MSQSRRLSLLAVLAAAAVVHSGCIKPLGTRVLIQTWLHLEDDVLGVHDQRDPYRGYYGATNRNIERNGYKSVNGATNGNAQDQRHELSVPNDWAFVNTDGDCFNKVTFNGRLADRGVADLKCRIFTGQNGNAWIPLELVNETYQEDGWGIPTPDDLGTNFLWSGQEMGVHQALSAGGGWYQLVLLDDGNLIQTWDGAYTQWSTETSGAVRLVMQGDGNLVLYNAGWTPLWASNTAGNPGAYLNIQDDGNLVVYSASDQPLWARW
jgi:hypothetical protein